MTKQKEICLKTFNTDKGILIFLCFILYMGFSNGCFLLKRVSRFSYREDGDGSSHVLFQCIPLCLFSLYFKFLVKLSILFI